MSASADSAVQTDRRLLVLFGHPSIERSEINAPLSRAVQAMEGITFVDLYAEYPDYDIDIDREQARLLAHDVIIFMHPMYWYSTPAIFKEWQDLVLEHGFAYGSEGKALHGKIFFSVLTTGGPETAYRAEGYNHFTIREILTPLEQTALLCGMTYLPPMTLFGARTAMVEARIEQHIDDTLRMLQAIQTYRIDVSQLIQLPKLNDGLSLIGAGE